MADMSPSQHYQALGHSAPPSFGRSADFSGLTVEERREQRAARVAALEVERNSAQGTPARRVDNEPPEMPGVIGGVRTTTSLTINA